MTPPRTGSRTACVAAFALVNLFAVALGTPARAEDPAEPAAPRLDPRRYELAGFPIIGGNSDIGFQFGGAATWTRFYDSAHPYLWNIDLLLSASLKSDTTGFRMVQQSHVLRLDAPDLFGGKARLDARGSFQRTINQGYYGIGNASVAVVPPGQPNVGRAYQYVQQEARVRAIVRVYHLLGPFDLALGGNLRVEAPQAYDGSQLATDLAAHESDGSPYLTGASTMLLGTTAAGVVLDTRDNEFITRQGVYYQLGVAGTVGSEDLASYGEASAVLAHYAPLGPHLVFASRFVGSFQFGRVPFYDLAQGGVFEPQYLLGSEQGVRGVPLGRYAGRVKMITNTEIRATPFPRFHLLGQRLRIGSNFFFDAGRVWSDYQATSAVDGKSLGLKYGVGAGLFLQWGEAAIFRVEVAYSPDAESENPGFPVGIYVSDGLMF